MSFTFTGPLPPPAFAAVLQGAAGSVTAAGRTELAKSIAKHLRPLGHEIGLWHAAIRMLQSRHLKNRLAPGLVDFISHWLPKEALPELPTEFALLLSANDHEMHLRSASVAFIRDPIWWALLQLPALRDAWTANMRASHFEHLLKTLPHAWLIDPAPLVPGSVIAGLGLGSWRDLPRLQNQGRHFEWLSSFGRSLTLESDWQPAIDQSLVSRDRLLVEVPDSSQWWLAHYGPRDGQIGLLEAHEATATEAGWAIQKAALA